MDLTLFRMDHPIKRQIGFFDKSQLEKLKGNVPDEVIEFLTAEGIATYSNNLLRTVLPDDYHELFTNWGLDGNNMYAVLCSSFGTIIYYQNDGFYAFKPLYGETYGASDNWDDFVNGLLGISVILKGSFFKELHDSLHDPENPLQEDEMYCFVPAIPLGGSIEKAKVEVVNRKIHLDILAQLFDHKTKEV